MNRAFWLCYQDCRFNSKNFSLKKTLKYQRRFSQLPCLTTENVSHLLSPAIEDGKSPYKLLLEDARAATRERWTHPQCASFAPRVPILWCPPRRSCRCCGPSSLWQRRSFVSEPRSRLNEGNEGGSILTSSHRVVNRCQCLFDIS